MPEILNRFYSLHLNEILEVLGAGCSITYSLLLMREKSIGWWFGIVSSFLGVWLFYKSKLYAHSMISFYFAAVGFYGLWYWKKAEEKNEHIHVWPLRYHLLFITIFSLCGWGCAHLFERFTDSARPYADSFITVFGLLASIKEARKILSSWVYWFIINAASVWLYYDQGLKYYAFLMIIYTVICIPGFINWYRIYKKYKPATL